MARWLGNPQPDEFVRLSAELLVAIARTPMRDRESRLVLAIAAASFGRYADHCHLTRTQLGKLAGLAAPQVMKGLAELIERGIVIAGAQERGKPVRLQIDKRYPTWTDGPSVDRAIEDAWRSIPRPAKPAGVEPDDRQISLLDDPNLVAHGKVQVSRGQVGVAHGKVSSDEDPASAPLPRAPREKREESAASADLARLVDHHPDATHTDDTCRCGCDPATFDLIPNPHTAGSELWARHENEARRRLRDADQLEALRSPRTTASRRTRPPVTVGDGCSPPSAGSKAASANTSPTDQEAT